MGGEGRGEEEEEDRGYDLVDIYIYNHEVAKEAVIRCLLQCVVRKRNHGIVRICT